MRTRLAVAVGLVALIAGSIALKTSAVIVDEGTDLRPFHTDPLYKVRVADEITFYAAKESKADPDVVSGSLLVALSTAALIASLILGATDGVLRTRRFYALAAIAFAALALDEFLAIHETIGYNLAPLADLPGVTRPDDVLFAALLIPTLAFIYAFRDILLSTARARWSFGGALGAFAMAAAFDITDLPGEEALEIVSGVLIVLGFAFLISTHVSACLAPPADSS